MLLRLFLLFTLVPLLEVFLLGVLGAYLGLWPTLALVLITGLVGAFLGRREGRRAWAEWREALSRGEMPEDGIIGGLLVLVGGVLLVTPGVLTDVTGLLLLFPASRARVAAWLKAYLAARFAGAATSVQFRVGAFDPFEGRTSTGIIETEGEVVEEARPRRAPLP